MGIRQMALPLVEEHLCHQLGTTNDRDFLLEMTEQYYRPTVVAFQAIGVKTMTPAAIEYCTRVAFLEAVHALTRKKADLPWRTGANGHPLPEHARARA